MQRINFGEWAPDQPGIAGSLTEATNVVSTASGYGPFPSVAALSSAASESINSIFTGIKDANVTTIAGGVTKLFKFNSATTNLDDVSKTGGYSTSTMWDFVQFGNVIVAANNVDKLQGYTIGTSTQFADLGAAAPIAKFVTVVRDFVVSANIGNGTNPNRVQWSDINDETDWVPGPTSQSDYQDMSDGGNITGLTGGEFGLVLMERGIARMTYSGSPFFFQFDIISRNIGCAFPGSVTQNGNITYFLANDGFYACNGQQIEPIGFEKVNRFFAADADQSKLDTISAAVDPIKGVIVWCYVNTAQQNALLIYNYNLKRWTYGITNASYISSAASNSVTLEGMDAYGNLDTIQPSIDSRVWVGGLPLMAGIYNNYLVVFSGAPSSASIATGDIQVEQSSVISSIKPIIDNGSGSAAVASRRNLDDSVTYSATVAENADGRCNIRSGGRFHRVKVIPSGQWKTVVGFDLELYPQGNR